MPSRTVLDVEGSRVLLPWREFEVTLLHIVGVTALVAGMVGLAFVLDGKGLVESTPTGLATGAIVPPVLWGLRYVTAKYTRGLWPLAIDRHELVGHSVLGGGVYVTWPDVDLVALLHSPMSRGPTPSPYGLNIYRKGKETLRVMVPGMLVTEQKAFETILVDIARMHQIEFILSETEAGERRLRRLPWF